jgi:phosphohistidine phosphatase SixA
MMKTALLVMLPVMLAAQTVFVVRHAERTGEPDPPLNAEGKARAERLAGVLRDAGVKRVMVSDTVRAQETAAPLAAQMGVKARVFAQTAIAELVSAVSEGGEGAVLVVGHRATVPKIVEALGGGKIPESKSGEHDRLVVLMRVGEAVRTVLLRY